MPEYKSRHQHPRQYQRRDISKHCPEGTLEGQLTWMRVEGPNTHHKTNLRTSSHIWVEQAGHLGAAKPELFPHLRPVSPLTHILSFAAIKIINFWLGKHAFLPFVAVHRSFESSCYIHSSNPSDALLWFVREALYGNQIRAQDGVICAQQQGAPTRLQPCSAHVDWLAIPSNVYSSILEKKERTTQHRNIFVHSTPVWLLLWAQLWALRWIPSEEDCCQLCFKNWTVLSMKYKCRVSWKVSDNAP